MKGKVEIRLHGSREDVLAAAEELSSHGAIFNERLYKDRGSEQIRLYGEISVSVLAAHQGEAI